MNESFTYFKDLIASRLSNVLVGGFFLSWVISHAREILTFLYSSSEIKLSMLKAYELSLKYDFAIPLTISITYITIIPLFSWIIKKYITNNIFKLESEAEILRLETSHKGRERIAVIAAKTTSDYAERFVNNQISTWVAEREATIKELDEQKSTNANIKAALEELKLNDAERRRELGYYKALYERSITSIVQAVGYLQNARFTSPEGVGIANRHGIHSKEYNEFISKQLASVLQGIIQAINTTPPIPFNSDSADWKPPINQASINLLSELLSNGSDGK